MGSSKSIWDRAHKKARPHLKLCVDTPGEKDQECLQQGRFVKAPYDCADTHLFPLCHALRKMTALRKTREEAAEETLRKREH